MPLWRRAANPAQLRKVAGPAPKSSRHPRNTDTEYPACSFQAAGGSKRVPCCVDAADSNMPSLADLASASGLRHWIFCSARPPCATGDRKDRHSTPNLARAHPRAPTPAVFLS